LTVFYHHHRNRTDSLFLSLLQKGHKKMST
jgi:hypothetical protein